MRACCARGCFERRCVDRVCCVRAVRGCVGVCCERVVSCRVVIGCVVGGGCITSFFVGVTAAFPAAADAA